MNIRRRRAGWRGDFSWRLTVQLQNETSPELLAATVSDAAVATLVVAGMAIGLVVPMRVRDVLVSAAMRRRALIR
jgi:hypothetical protein